MKTEVSNVTVRHSKVVERAATALENEPRLRGATIDAVDENGIVTLTGTEPSDDVRLGCIPAQNKDLCNRAHRAT